MGHKAVLNVLLDEGADPESKDTAGNTQLWHAARCGHENLVMLLLERGADIKSIGSIREIVLWGAARNKAKAIARLDRLRNA
jgi:ankyrin repeat protein